MQRPSAITKLQFGLNFKFQAERDCYVIIHKSNAGLKTSAPILVHSASWLAGAMVVVAFVDMGSKSAGGSTSSSCWGGSRVVVER